MNSNQILLSAFLAAALKNESIRNIDLSEVDLEAIYEDALAHEVHTLIYPLIKNITFDNASNNALMSEWHKKVLLSGITQIQHMDQIGKLFDEFSNAEIPFIALKGLVLRELYPSPELRTMGDADILIEKNHMKNAVEILLRNGYVKLSEDSKHIHFIHNNHLSIELHYYLINKSLLKNNIDKFEEKVWKKAKTSCICNKSVLILCPEDQMLHLILHMAVHLSSSGFGLRQLCDLSIFTESIREKIEWNEVFNKTNECDITPFTSALFIVCKKLFNTDIPAPYQTIPIDETYIEYLIEDIFSGGIYGKRTFERKVYGIKQHYINHLSYDGQNRKLFSIISTLFPSSQKLGDTYSYAKKYPILTPAAWIHRICIGIFRKDFTLSEKKSVLIPKASTSSVIIKRVKLLHWLDLK